MKTGKASAARHRFLAWVVLLPVLLALRATAFGATDQTIYDEALASGWQNWSWASVDLASTANANTGAVSIAVTPAPFSALYLRSADAPVDTNGYLNLTFYVHGGATGGQIFQVQAIIGDAAQPGVRVNALAAGTWQKITVPLSSLGVENRTDVSGFWFQEIAGVDSPTFYIDTVVLESGVPPTPPPPVNGMAIYQEALVNGWNNWSWASVNTGSTANVHTGSSAIAVTADAFEALYLQHAAMPTDAFESLKFWIHGGATGGQTLNVAALRTGVSQPSVQIGPLPAGAWQEFVIPLAQLGIANVGDLDGLWLQDNSGTTQPTFYVDDIHLEFAPPPSLVTVTVDPKQRIRKVDRRMFGINAAVWDGAYASPNTQALLTELKNQALRFPGGSLSDEYHWQTNMSEGQTFEWATSFDEFAQIAGATRAASYITANYGTGTPEEAAGWVRYANKAKRLNIRYWEIGNENYGAWERDNNTRPHDPVTYANRFKEYWLQMKAVDPSIKIGAVVALGEDAFANYPEQVVTNPRTGQAHSGWTPVMLDTLRQLGVTPDFVVYHRYEQGPGGESDLFLLTASDDRRLPGCQGQACRARLHRAQLGVQQSRQADHQPGERPVLRRCRWQSAEDRVQRAAVVGSAQRPGGRQQQQLLAVWLASLWRLRHRQWHRSGRPRRPVSDLLRQQTTEVLRARRREGGAGQQRLPQPRRLCRDWRGSLAAHPGHQQASVGGIGCHHLPARAQARRKGQGVQLRNSAGRGGAHRRRLCGRTAIDAHAAGIDAEVLARALFGARDPAQPARARQARQS
jgi:hypothetical protein